MQIVGDSSPLETFSNNNLIEARPSVVKPVATLSDLCCQNESFMLTYSFVSCKTRLSLTEFIGSTRLVVTAALEVCIVFNKRIDL